LDEISNCYLLRNFGRALDALYGRLIAAGLRCDCATAATRCESGSYANSRRAKDTRSPGLFGHKISS
jgi:hypothetical protein